MLLAYRVYWELVCGFHLHGILLSYLALPIPTTEFLLVVEPLSIQPGGLLLPALPRQKWAAQAIADFWGPPMEFVVQRLVSLLHLYLNSPVQYHVLN